jgi:hypothetical protein
LTNSALRRRRQAARELAHPLTLCELKLEQAPTRGPVLISALSYVLLTCFELCTSLNRGNPKVFYPKVWRTISSWLHASLVPHQIPVSCECSVTHTGCVGT